MKAKWFSLSSLIIFGLTVSAYVWDWAPGWSPIFQILVIVSSISFFSSGFCLVLDYLILGYDDDLEFQKERKKEKERKINELRRALEKARTLSLSSAVSTINDAGVWVNGDNGEFHLPEIFWEVNSPRLIAVTLLTLYKSYCGLAEIEYLRPLHSSCFCCRLASSLPWEFPGLVAIILMEMINANSSSTGREKEWGEENCKLYPHEGLGFYLHTRLF